MDNKKIDDLNKLPELLDFLLNGDLGLLKPKIYDVEENRQGDSLAYRIPRELNKELHSCNVKDRISLILKNKNILPAICVKKGEKQFLVIEVKK
jgi:antitoxin component of MazEF toxin-antitoxin module